MTLGTNTFGTMSAGDSTRELNLGRCPWLAPICQLDGRLDEVQIYDRALPSSMTAFG